MQNTFLATAIDLSGGRHQISSSPLTHERSYNVYNIFKISNSNIADRMRFKNRSLLDLLYIVIFYILFKDKCGPGEYSDTGLSPCSPCSKSTYQSKSMSTSCIQCPTGLTTAFTGSTNVQNCTGMNMHLYNKCICLCNIWNPLLKFQMTTKLFK